MTEGAWDDLAREHGMSMDAVRVLREALRRGHGRQAQFSHPDLGGMGQWSSAGMTQVGDMFNTALRDKVAALCGALAGEAASAGASATAETSPPAGEWWPSGLGRPSSTELQDGMRYACFPQARRVTVERVGGVTVYDSGEHRIGGVAQRQGATRELTFNSQLGTIEASELPVARD